MLLRDTSLPTVQVCSARDMAQEESKSLLLLRGLLCLWTIRGNGPGMSLVGRNVWSWWEPVQTLLLTRCGGGWCGGGCAEPRRWRYCVQSGASLVSSINCTHLMW